MREFPFSDRLASLSGTATREILKLTQGGDVISFAGGLPAKECLPQKRMAAILSSLMEKCGTALLQYGVSEGDAGLRRALAALVRKDGIAADENSLTVISGGQQGLELTVKAFVNEGDTVLVEDPTYLAFLQIVRSYRGECRGVKANADGLDLDDLEVKIKTHKPKLLYVVPTFSNPTGKCYSIENRKGILALCERYGVMILEDDPYSKLRFNGEFVPSIKSLDKSGSVVYVTSLSKVLSPGLRIGAAVAHETVTKKLVIGKQNTDLHSSAVSQAIAREYLDGGFLEGDVSSSLGVYRTRKNAMTAALERYLPELERTDPDGGLFIFLKAKGRDMDALMRVAVENKVAYVPGSVFYCDGAHHDTFRLNYSNADEETIERGIKILAQVIKGNDE